MTTHPYSWRDENGKDRLKRCGHQVGYHCCCHEKNEPDLREPDCVDYFKRPHYGKITYED